MSIMIESITKKRGSDGAGRGGAGWAGKGGTPNYGI